MRFGTSALAIWLWLWLWFWLWFWLWLLWLAAIAFKRMETSHSDDDDTGRMTWNVRPSVTHSAKRAVCVCCTTRTTKSLAHNAWIYFYELLSWSSGMLGTSGAVVFFRQSRCAFVCACERVSVHAHVNTALSFAFCRCRRTSSRFAMCIRCASMTLPPMLWVWLLLCAVGCLEECDGYVFTIIWIGFRDGVTEMVADDSAVLGMMVVIFECVSSC